MPDVASQSELIAVIVTIPADAGDTVNPEPKLIVPAVPTVESLSFITRPVPDATTPVNPEPLPMNEVAVTTPETASAFIVLPRSNPPANFNLPLSTDRGCSASAESTNFKLLSDKTKCLTFLAAQPMAYTALLVGSI